MTQPLASSEIRQHLYPDDHYGETPDLAMPGGGTAASLAARLMVKLGVDGRGPQAGTVSPEDRASASTRLAMMKRAAAAAGFAIDVRLAKPDGTGTTRAYYTHTPNEVGLIVADRPPQTSGRIFNLRWVLDGDGVRGPEVPAYANDGAAYLESCAQAYDDLWSSVMGAGDGPVLEVVRARLMPYQPLPH